MVKCTWIQNWSQPGDATELELTGHYY